MRGDQSVEQSEKTQNDYISPIWRVAPTVSKLKPRVALIL